MLRHAALEKLVRIEEETESHSVALGQLGPPELSKLLYEAHLLKLNYNTLERVVETSPTEIAETLYDFLLGEDNLRTTITSIAISDQSPIDLTGLGLAIEFCIDRLSEQADVVSQHVRSEVAYV